MKYLVPNCIVEDFPSMLLVSEKDFIVAQVSKTTKSKVTIHTLMHSMSFLEEGTKRVYFKEYEKVLQKGSIFFLSQGNYYMSDMLESESMCKSTVIYFDDKFILDFIAKHKITLDSCELKVLVDFPSDEVLKHLMDSYLFYMGSEVKHKSEILRLKTEEIFLHLLSVSPRVFSAFLKEVSESSKDKIRYVLEANVELIKTVEDMCKITRLNESQLRIEIQTIFSMTPKIWLDMKRLKYASYLLVNTQSSITSIATTCGYSTVSWFGVQFKKHYYMTPKTYREENQ
jgi:AraC-like DNA-binding protein